MSYTVCEKCGNACAGYEQPCFLCQARAKLDASGGVYFPDEDLKEKLEAVFKCDPNAVASNLDCSGKKVASPPGPGRAKERRKKVNATKALNVLRGPAQTPKKKKRK